jgi:hypothetical protein
VFINWDKIYNGSSGERVGDDLCRMSIGWYDYDQDDSVYMQDYDPTDDTTPYPATDGMSWSDDPVFLAYNDSQNWLYFMVDTSISGEPMADPVDPPAQGSSIDAIIDAIYAMVVVLVVLSLLGIVMKSFSKWFK